MNNCGKICKVSGCTNKARCKGLCNYHYNNIYSHREMHNGKKHYINHTIIEE